MTVVQHRNALTAKSQIGDAVAIRRIFAAFDACATGQSD